MCVVIHVWSCRVVDGATGMCMNTRRYRGGDVSCLFPISCCGPVGMDVTGWERRTGARTGGMYRGWCFFLLLLLLVACLQGTDLLVLCKDSYYHFGENS